MDSDDSECFDEQVNEESDFECCDYSVSLINANDSSLLSDASIVNIG